MNVASHFDVSVVIPTISGRECSLLRAVSSILDPGLAIELVIVSTPDAHDSLAKVLSCCDFPLKLVNNDGVGSAASNRNLGIKHARGRFVAFLDDDDEFRPGKLAAQQAAMLATGAKWSFSNYILRDEARQWRCTQFSGRAVLSRHLDLEKNCPIATPTVMCERQSMIEAELFFDTRLTVREDVDLWIRMLGSFPVLYLPEAMAVVNRSVDSAFSTGLLSTSRESVIRRLIGVGVRWSKVLRDSIDGRFGRGYVVSWSSDGSISRGVTVK